MCIRDSHHIHRAFVVAVILAVAAGKVHFYLFLLLEHPDEPVVYLSLIHISNMTKFDTVDQQHITYGDQSIPISETYFEFIKKYLEDHSL